MIFKNTTCSISNKIELFFLKVIHLYNLVKQKGARVSHFIRTVLKNFFFKEVLYKKMKKKSFFLLSKKKCFFKDLSFFFFFINSTLVVKKRLTPLGTYVYGPTYSFLKRKKLQLSFTILL